MVDQYQPQFCFSKIEAGRGFELPTTRLRVKIKIEGISENFEYIFIENIPFYILI